MGDQCAFDFGGAHAVTRYVDHVINTAGDPVIAIIIATCAITGGVDVFKRAEIGLDEAFMVTIDRPHLTRPAVLDDKVAIGCTGQFLAFVIKQGRLNTKERQGRRTRFEVGRTRQRRNQDAAGFGLPPGIDNRAVLFADMLVIPFPGFRVDRLTHRTQQAQTVAGGAVHAGLTFGHQGTDGGRCGVQDIDLVLVHHLAHAGRVRVVGYTFKQNGDSAVGKRAVQNVAVTGDPTEVRSTPIDVAIMVIKHVLMGHRGVHHVPARGVQYAFRGAGGT